MCKYINNYQNTGYAWFNSNIKFLNDVYSRIVGHQSLSGDVICIPCLSCACDISNN